MTEFLINDEELIKCIQQYTQQPYNPASYVYEYIKSKKPIEPFNRDKAFEIYDKFVDEFTEAKTDDELETVRNNFIRDIFNKLSPQPEPSKDNIAIVMEELPDFLDEFLSLFEKGKTMSREEYATKWTKLLKAFAHNLLSKLNIEYATPEKIREIIKAFLKKNIREALYDVLPFEDLVKELSQLAKPKQGDK